MAHQHRLWAEQLARQRARVRGAPVESPREEYTPEQGEAARRHLEWVRAQPPQLDAVGRRVR